MATQMESMAHRMRAPVTERTTKAAANGGDPRRRDVLMAAVAAAHADAERGRTNADVARRYSRPGRELAARTASDWRRQGPPEAREFATYLLVVSDPFRIEASVRATVKQRAIANLATPDLIARYHELLQHEPAIEAEDRVLDVSRGVCWLKRAAASERDAAIDAEKAACEREFAARGVSEAEVFGGRR